MSRCEGTSIGVEAESSSLFGVTDASPTPSLDNVLGTWADRVSEEDEDEMSWGDHVENDAVSRVDALISRATDELEESSSAEDIDTAAESPGHRAQTRKKLRQARGSTGTGVAPNPQRSNEIAQVLAGAQTMPAQIQAYIVARDFGRVPPFLLQVRAELDAEFQYIDLLPQLQQEEAPRAVVRLLRQAEKDEQISGLRHQFQHVTAAYLATKFGSRSKGNLQAELDKIKRDIDNLSRPYIFVEQFGSVFVPGRGTVEPAQK